MPQKRLAVNKMLSVVGESKNVYIVIYGNVDPDALGSAWALKEILRSKNISSEIGYTGQVGRVENEAMIASLRIPVGPIDQQALDKADKVALVDAQPEFFKDYELERCDIVIDHHPRKSDKIFPFTDIRPKCLATSSIMTEYFLDLSLPVSKRLATALYYGILTDMKGMRRSPSPIDEQALAFLEKVADMTALRKIESSQYTLTGLDYLSIALVKRRYAKNVLYSHLSLTQYTDVCSQVADFFIRVREAKWAVVSGIVGKSLVVVFRCEGRSLNAGKLAMAAFGKLGSAGGHKTMGRAEIDQASLKDLELNNNEKVEDFVIRSLAKEERAFVPLLKTLPTSEGGAL